MEFASLPETSTGKVQKYLLRHRNWITSILKGFLTRMEIEAKFAVADASTFRKLKSVTHLGGFALSEGITKRVRDTYLDTKDRLILAAGYFCRRRNQGGKPVITVKSLKAAKESINRREELELTLDHDLPPAEWPEGPVRNLILRIAGREPLVVVLELRQTRFVRAVTREASHVAEMSLDRVSGAGSERIPAYFELEIELLPEGTERDLRSVASCLQHEWKLKPDPRSKFERASESTFARFHKRSHAYASSAK